MSWDLFATKIPPACETTADIPDGWEPPVIGSRTEQIERIQQIIPGADFSDRTWGHIDGPDYSIDVSLSEDEMQSMIAFFIRGDDAAAFVAADIITGLGLRAFDTGSNEGTIFPGKDVTEGLRHWRRFREQALRR